MRPITAACTLLLPAVVLLAPTTASASHGLLNAANEYRDAVRRFERTVLRARCFNRHEEQLVNNLEQASHRLRSAARHPNDRQRLLRTWNEILSHQALIARNFVGHPRCPAGGEVANDWARVLLAGTEFATQLALIPCGVPRLPYGIPSYGVLMPPVYCIPIPHHHHPEPQLPEPARTPLPYWHPARTPYGRGTSVPKVDRVISASKSVQRDSSDIRKFIVPSTSRAQIQRTLSTSKSRGIISAPAQRTLGSDHTGAKLMRRF